MPTTKYEFTRQNEIRRKEGLPLLNWKSFVQQNGKQKVGRPRMEEHLKKPQSRRTGMYLNFLPDEEKPLIKREPARYDNQSFEDIYKKYGV
jgi:hypothetical protein